MLKTRAKELALIAQCLRIEGLKMIQAAGSGHIGGAFSLSEIMAVLYFEKMRLRPEDPQWEDRDRFVMSKGHATAALYATLALRGFFPVDHLKTFRKIDSNLSGHVEMRHIPGVDMSTGSLGQGLSAALGMACGARLLGKDYTVYAVVGDGELQEGQVWEALTYAGARRVRNLVTIIDYNRVQLEMRVSEVFGEGDLAERFRSFGFNVLSIDGHDVEAVSEAVDAAKSDRDRATVILANTVKAKGVAFMEGECKWHGKLPSPDEFVAAFTELEQAKTRLEASNVG